MNDADPAHLARLVELAQALASDRDALGPLLDDVGRIADEVARVAIAMDGAADASPVRAILQTALQQIGLGALIDDEPALPALRDRLRRLHALLASLALTRLPRDGAP